MGAPLRSWLLRILGTLAATAAAAGILSLDVPLGFRLGSVAAGLLLAAGVAFRVLPAFDPLGRVRWRLPRGARASRCCAITFDDGPTPATSAALDILAEQKVPATFFVLGRHVRRRPDLVCRMQAEGHAVGLHGLTHAKLHGREAPEVDGQITGALEALRAAGVEPAPIYRTPHGFKSARVFDAARGHGLSVWAWSRGVWDTDRPDPSTLVRRATRLARPGLVLLLHDGRGDDPAPDVSPMIAALPGILRELKRRRFTFVRLTDV
jgi:peptidoglycan/xylan/chitin deacetylase (PgdA/CDA1 family)